MPLPQKEKPYGCRQNLASTAFKFGAYLGLFHSTSALHKSLLLSEAEECFHITGDVIALLWINVSVCSKQEKKNLYKRSGEIMCCFGSDTSLPKSFGELDLPLFCWDIYCLPWELSGSVWQPACSRCLPTVVPRSGLVPRDPSESREMSQGTNPLRHF